MYPLLETIKCKDGKLFNLEFHQARLEKSQKEYFGISPKIKLTEEILIPEFAKNGLFRCRVTYLEQIDSIEFFPYHFRIIKSLKIIEDNKIDYRFKYSDREKLNQLFEKRGSCDDIIIVKNGCLADSFVSNLVLSDGEKWWTPDTPLLPGTQRERLLKEGKIIERRILVDDISKFKKVGLINAFNDLTEMQVVACENLFF
jgi:4-amino-4-deoxychorismate lyase